LPVSAANDKTVLLSIVIIKIKKKLNDIIKNPQDFIIFINSGTLLIFQAHLEYSKH